MSDISTLRHRLELILINGQLYINWQNMFNVFSYKLYTIKPYGCSIYVLYYKLSEADASIVMPMPCFNAGTFNYHLDSLV